MAPYLSKEAPPSQLIKFQIIPRETIRACIKIFCEDLSEVRRYTRLEGSKLQRSAYKLLENPVYKWPLTLQVDSELWKEVSEIKLLATTLLRSTGVSYANVLGKYVTTVLEFYDYGADTSPEGVVMGNEVVVLRQPLSYTGQVPKRKKRHQPYVDSPLDSEKGELGFTKVVLAAKFKSDQYPHESARTEDWLQRRDAALADVPEMLRDIISIHKENERETKSDMEEDSNVDGGLLNVTCGTSLSESKATIPQCTQSETRTSPPSLTERPAYDVTNLSECEETSPQFTPAETRSSSPTPTERPTPNVNKSIDGFKLTFLAILETPTEKVTVNINHTRVNSPECKVLDATKEIWAWVTKKGMDDKASLEEVVELARSMVAKREEDTVHDTSDSIYGFKLTYVAVLETSTEKVTITINPASVKGPEGKVLDMTKELWAWMTDKGVNDKVRLEDVFELAGKVVARKENDMALAV